MKIWINYFSIGKIDFFAKVAKFNLIKKGLQIGDL